MSNIEDLVQSALEKDFTKAEDIFSTIMHDKMADALEQEKVSVASSIFNEVEEEDEVSDEELEDAADEVLEDEDFEEDAEEESEEDE